MTVALHIPESRGDKIKLAQLLDERQKRAARTDFLTYVKRTTPGYEVNWHHQGDRRGADGGGAR